MPSAEPDLPWVKRCALIGLFVVGFPILAIWGCIDFYFDWTSELAAGAAVVGSFTIGIWCGAAWAHRHPRP